MDFILQSVRQRALTAHLVTTVRNLRLLLLKCFQTSVPRELFAKKRAQLMVSQHSADSPLTQPLNLKPTEVMLAVRTAFARQEQSQSLPTSLHK